MNTIIPPATSPIPVPTPTPTPTPTPAPTAAQVKHAENALAKLGYSPGARDGKVSPAFTAAVKEFQTANGYAATGTLDARTTARMDTLVKAVAEHARKKDEYVTVGLKSKDVTVIEQRLRKLGYATGKVDGIYSQETAAAVRAFRADQKELPKNYGSLWKGSRAVLARESAKLEHAPERRRLAPTTAQLRLDRTTAQASAAGLREGARSDAVKNVQAHLRAAGFDPKHVNGQFDERTAGAVRAFQRRSKLPVTGVVDPRTWGQLKKAYVLSKQPAAPAQSVGERSAAVKSSEALLKKLGFKTGKVDGFFDKNTAKAVRAFERQQGLKVDGQISTGQLSLMKKLSKGVTLSQLHRIMPSLPMSKARAYLPLLNRAMAEAHINTKPRKAMFLAQLAHESVQLKYFEEIASGAAYEGRRDLGNTHPGDGKRYKGRGPIQLTGRANYRSAGKALHLPLEAHPTMAARPSVGFRVAGWFWTSRGLNKVADRGDFNEVTRRINGGYNGLESRRWYYRRALAVL